MAEKPRISEAEEQLYSLTIEEAVEEVSKLPKDSADAADAIIQRFLNDVQLHEKKRVIFRGEVLQKVAEQKRKAEDERERKILEKFEGHIADIDGKLSFAGVDENEKFYVRGGTLFGRIFGERYNADKTDKILREVQKLEDEIEEKRLKIEMLRASYEASRSLVKNARQIFKAKREGRFVVGYIDDRIASWRAAKSQKERATERYKKSDDLKRISKEEKQLAQKKDVLTKLRQKVDERRKNGRRIFEEQFGKQVEILQQMSSHEQKKELDRLREDVQEFGAKLGIVSMEYFLNEALGISPKTSGLTLRFVKDEKTGEMKRVYEAPLTAKEAAQELATLSRWCEFIFGSAPTPNEMSTILTSLREQEPALLTQSLQEQKSGTPSPIMYELRFLFSGKDTKGLEILESSRRAHSAPENVVRLLRYASEHEGVTQDRLQNIFETFADRWPDEYKAEDFGYIFDFLKENKEPPPPVRESMREREKREWAEGVGRKAREVWIRVVGRDLNQNQFIAFLNEIDNRQYNREQIDQFLSANRQHDLMRFFYTGKFGSEDIIVDPNDLYKPNDVAQFVDSYEQANKILRVENPSDEQMIKVLRRLQGMDEFKKNGLKALDTDLFKKLLREVKDEEKQAKSQPTVVVNQAPAPVSTPQPASPPAQNPAQPQQADPPAAPSQPVSTPAPPQTTPEPAPTPAQSEPATPQAAPASQPQATVAPSKAPDALSAADYGKYSEIYDMILHKNPSKSEIKALDDYFRSQVEGMGRDIKDLRNEFIEAKEHHEIMGFFLSGDYDGENFATRNFVPEKPENIMKLYLLADQILKLDPKPTKETLKKLFKRRKTAIRRLAAKSIDEIEELINKLR